MDFSVFIFLSVLMVAIGYIASNSRDFNFWHIALLGLILIPLFDQFDFSKPHIATITVAFIIGYLLPYAHVLEGLSDAISNAINAIRYKDAYEDKQQLFQDEAKKHRYLRTLGLDPGGSYSYQDNKEFLEANYLRRRASEYFAGFILT